MLNVSFLIPKFPSKIILKIHNYQQRLKQLLGGGNDSLHSILVSFSALILLCINITSNYFALSGITSFIILEALWGQLWHVETDRVVAGRSIEYDQ